MMRSQLSAVAILVTGPLLFSGCAAWPHHQPSQHAVSATPSPPEEPPVDLEAVPVTEGAQIKQHEQISLSDSASFVFQKEPKEFFWDQIKIRGQLPRGVTQMRSPDMAATVLGRDGSTITVCRTFKNWIWPLSGEMSLHFECHGNFSEEQKSDIASVEVELGRVTF